MSTAAEDVSSGGEECKHAADNAFYEFAVGAVHLRCLLLQLRLVKLFVVNQDTPDHSSRFSRIHYDRSNVILITGQVGLTVVGRPMCWLCEVRVRTSIPRVVVMRVGSEGLRCVVGRS